MLKFIKTYLDHRGPFPERIRSRHKQFWQDPNAEIVRNTLMNVEDGFEKWKDVVNWQRKLSNKYNSREFAGKHGCKIPLLIWKGRDIDDIDFKNLPENYVIRPTIGHSANSVYLMKKNYNLFDKKNYTNAEIKKILKADIESNKDLEYLVEEFLTNENGQNEILKDYKMYCFNGEIACIWVINRLSPKSGFGYFYDENWEPLKMVSNIYPKGKPELAPKCLKEMVKQAKALSKTYEIFVRIDFYATDKGAVFGEFTPTPGLGSCTSRYGQKLLISYWDKYCNGKV
jgi:hypothetical protein